MQCNGHDLMLETERMTGVWAAEATLRVFR